VPLPAAGVVEYLHLQAISVMGSSPTIDLGPVTRSVLILRTPAARIGDGAALPVQGTVTPSVPTVPGLPLPASSMQVRCVAAGNGTETTKTFSPSTSTSAFATTIGLHGTSTCSVAFHGDTTHGLTWSSSPSFLVRVVAGASIKAATYKIRHGARDLITMSASANARDAWIYLDQWNGKRWVHVGGALAKGRASISLSVTKPKAGTYKYRTYIPPTNWHEAGSSRTISIKVT
jgi:hypothetical protein